MSGAAEWGIFFHQGAELGLAWLVDGWMDVEGCSGVIRFEPIEPIELS